MTVAGRFPMPIVVFVLMAITVVMSIAGAICERNGIPLVQKGVFVPSLVWQGEVWRLVTWIFYELSPINLVFYVVILYWLGRDLANRWGSLRFIAMYLGLAIACAAGTALIGKFLWTDVYSIPHFGSWAVTDGLIIAWAVYNPNQQINLYFVIPVTGKALVWITIGGTILYALFEGFGGFVPHFLAEAMMLLYVGQLRRWFLRFRLQRMENQKKRYVNNVIRLDREEERKSKPDPDDDRKPPKWLN